MTAHADRAPDDPTDIPRRSWWATLKRTVREFQEDNLTDWAAALTYYAVLSVFPALIALLSIVGLVADPATVSRVITETVSEIGPATAAETFNGPIDDITASGNAAGLTLVLGLAGALWTASGYVGAFMRASNAIYETEEGRPFWKLRPLQILVTLTMVMLLAVVVLGLVLTGPLAEAIGNAAGIGDTAVTIFQYGKWPVLLAMVMAMLAILYFASPNAKLPGIRWISPGSVVAVVIWLLASVGFAFYVANFGSYGETYGTLGGVVSFLVWMWITNLAVLFGAELNAELERTRELQAGEPAEDEIQLPPRTARKTKDKARTA